jgi:hypothetical protein
MLRSAPELLARWLWIADLRARARIPEDDDESFFVNAMFTTFMRVRFTNVFE